MLSDVLIRTVSAETPLLITIKKQVLELFSSTIPNWDADNFLNLKNGTALNTTNGSAGSLTQGWIFVLKEHKSA